MAVNLKAINKILQTKFTPLNGKLTDVFVAHGNGNEKRYDCRCCYINDLTHFTLLGHANGKKHKRILEEIVAETDKMASLRVETSSESKDGISTSQLQKKINEIKNQAIIGLEYVIEVHMASNFECVYHCVLCEGRFDFTTVVSHVTAYNHRWKYLEKHFPTAYKELSELDSTEKREHKRRLTEKLCEAIEDQFGRLSSLVVDNKDFTKNRMQYTDKVSSTRHIDEYMGCTFIELMQDNMRKEQHPQHNQQNLSDFSDFEEEELKSRRASLDSISASNESYRSASVISLSSNVSSSDLTLSTSSGENSSKRKQPAKIAPIQFRSKALIADAERVERETYKMEKFRLQIAAAEQELKEKYDGYKETPTTHPGYIAEWKVYWTKRYKELRADKQSVDKHDFKPEWIIAWKKIMDEKLKNEIESKTNEIKQKLGIQNPELTIKAEDTSASNMLKTKISIKSIKKSIKEDNLSAQRKSRSLSKDVKGLSKKILVSNRRSKSSRSPVRRSHDRRRSRSPRRFRSTRKRSRSARKRSRSPRKRSRSPRKRSRSPRKRSQSPRKRSRSPKKRSRSPKKRSPSSRRRSRSPLRSHSPRRTRFPTRPRRNRSRSLRRSKSSTSNSDMSPCERKLTPTTLRMIKQSPWPNRDRTSMSPKLVEKRQSPLQAVKPIMKRRNTSHFSATMLSSIFSKQKLCTPIPPRIAKESASYYSPIKGRLNLENNIRKARTTPSLDSSQNRNDEPITIISVLSLLTALEDILGSLGPKVIELMHQAISMDKIKDNSSNQLLDNDDHCVLFETIKEKLKGLISADLVEKNKQNAVKKAIKNMALLVHQTNERQKAAALESSLKQQTPPLTLPQQKTHPTVSKEERDVIAAKLTTALRNEGRTDITDKQLEYLIDVYLTEVAEKEKKSIANDNNISLPKHKEVRPQGQLGESISILSIDMIDIENKDELYDHITNRVHVPVSSSASKSISSTSAVPVSLSSKVPISSSSSKLQISSSSKLPISSSSKLPISSSSKVTASFKPSTVQVTHTSTVQVPSSSTISVSAPQRTRQKMSSVRQNNTPNLPTMCPPPSETESVTLSDSDLKILMKKFNSLSESEQASYLSYINKLEAIDPQRMKRLKDEMEIKEKAKHSIPTPKNDKCEKIINSKNDSRQRTNEVNKPNKQNSTLIYSPGQNLSSDNEDEKTTAEPNKLIDSDSDSDDSAILASSIANTQFQIAKMNKDLTPKPTGRKIPVVDSVQTQQFSKRIETVSFPREEIFDNQRQVPRPTFPTLHYQQQNFQPHPHPQQYPYQQPYPQYQRQIAPQNTMQLPPHTGTNYFNQTQPQFQGSPPYHSYYPRY